MARLAIVDWGVGGLGFYREWKRHRSNESVLYFSDSGSVPYGKLSEIELADRLDELFEFLQMEHGITHVIVACNAASTAIHRCRESELAVLGIVDPTVEFVRQFFSPGELGFVGGRRIVESSCYSIALPEFQIDELLGQPLSAHVEAGELRGEKVELSIKKLLGRFEGNLILCCTHYVALKRRIEALCPAISCHDPIPSIVLKFEEQLEAFEQGIDIFLTTGETEQTRRVAKRAFRVELESIKTCKL